MAVPSTDFDMQKDANAILYGDKPQTSTLVGRAQRFPFEPPKMATGWSELRYRLRASAGYLRLALSVLRHG